MASTDENSSNTTTHDEAAPYTREDTNPAGFWPFPYAIVEDEE